MYYGPGASVHASSKAILRAFTVAIHAGTMSIVDVCTMVVVHECTVAIVHACTMAIVGP